MDTIENDQMISYENILFDLIDDDWFVSDEYIGFIGEIEYRLYELECNEVYKDAR